MSLRNGLVPVRELGLHVGGNGVLPLSTGKTFFGQNFPNYDCQSYLHTFPLKFPNVNLGAPKHQHRLISLENAKTCWLVQLQDGGDAIADKNRFYHELL